MKQLYVRGRDVDPVVPDMKACTDTSKPEQSPLGRRPLDPKDGALLTAAAMASRRDFGAYQATRRSAGASHLTKEVQNGYVETINSHRIVSRKG
jgi:hypothetical protein